jgi:hypothetical protein
VYPSGGAAIELEHLALVGDLLKAAVIELMQGHLEGHMDVGRGRQQRLVGALVAVAQQRPVLVAAVILGLLSEGVSRAEHALVDLERVAAVPVAANDRFTLISIMLTSIRSWDSFLEAILAVLVEPGLSLAYKETLSRWGVTVKEDVEGLADLVEAESVRREVRGVPQRVVLEGQSPEPRVSVKGSYA